LRYACLRVAPPPQEQARLLASLVAEGQQSPVTLVHDRIGPQRYVLIDGYRRVEALRELGRDLVQALALPMQQAEALIHAHRLERSGQRNALEQGWLLHTLLDEHGLTQAQLSLRLDRSRSWVSRRLSLVTLLPAVVQEALRQGQIPARGAMRSLVPLARANSEACGRLVANLGHEPVTARQLQTLYQGWLKADAEGRERIEAQPRLFLKVQPSEPEQTPTQRFIDDLRSIERLCWRARRQLDEGDVDCRRPRIGRLLGEVQRSSQALCTRLQEELDAGTGHARGGAGAVVAGALDSSDRQGAVAEPQHGPQGLA
ncbi:MAG: ParB N-terminal domain-containing protein, partial [Candidatus Heimdallarchaeota archaeon]|nr:ParB N-terminal domain-containing protein [Candidatus Heimdallarchaeota archaeon]